MKTMVIIGAGQMGKAAAELLHPNKWKLLAFGDNDPALQGSVIEVRPGADVPVTSVEQALSLAPDGVLISVLGEERAEHLRQQASESGFAGEILSLRDSWQLFDVRSRCIGQMAVRILELGIRGAVAELGVYRGDTAWQLNALLPERKLYLFDTFSGFDVRDTQQEASPHAKAGRFGDTSLEEVMARMPHPEHVLPRQGYFPETAAGLEHERFALVSLDPDLYAPTLEGMRFFYPRMSDGGMIVVHDYNNKQFEGVRNAVRAFEDEMLRKDSLPLQMVPLGDLHGSMVIVKTK